MRLSQVRAGDQLYLARDITNYDVYGGPPTVDSPLDAVVWAQGTPVTVIAKGATHGRLNIQCMTEGFTSPYGFSSLWISAFWLTKTQPQIETPNVPFASGVKVMLR